MQINPTNEKGLSAPATQTQAMQTTAHFLPTAPEFQHSLELFPASVIRPMTPRQWRLAGLLLIGPASREQVDRQVGCSNSPDEIFRFRRKYNLTVPCEFHKGVDRDGHAIEFGVYSLTATDRERLESIMLALAGGATC